MATGKQGTFVMAWAQTALDGLAAPPPDLLAPGARWRWTGRALCIDGTQDVLLLQGGEGMADLRQRAGRAVRRRIGIPANDVPAPPPPRDAPPADGFTVTDGRASWSVTLIALEDRTPLLSISGDLPPTDTDLWIVRATPPRRRAASPHSLICFTPGTRLRTPAGDAPVETLRRGDRVQTRDGGPQPVLWTGRRRIGGGLLYALPHLRPIRLRSDAPDLLVSPQHRVLVSRPAVRALFGTSEVLVAADDLRDDRRITRDHLLSGVTYLHILLPAHHIVWANGWLTETFHPGLAGPGTLDLVQADPLPVDPATYGEAARRRLTRAEAAILGHDRPG